MGDESQRVETGEKGIGRSYDAGPVETGKKQGNTRTSVHLSNQKDKSAKSH